MKKDVIYQTDAISGLKTLDSESIDCIVTSPPYWQLRDYGNEELLWGGNEQCVHEFDYRKTCLKCGGWIGQLGHEPVREMYINHLLMIFCECQRVLKKTGTLWVNLGDSYSKPYKYNYANGSKLGSEKNRYSLKDMKVNHLAYRIASKSLCNIPGLFAEEMVRNGWILRNEIIWHKTSCIPASVKDRFTVDFEKLFFFTKKEKYYFAQQFEPYAMSTLGRYKHSYSAKGGKNAVYRNKYGAPRGFLEINPNGRNKRTVWRIDAGNSKYMHFASYPPKLIETPVKAGCPAGGVVLDPFTGSGTTAITAKRLGRHYIGIEPNAAYVEICKQRLKNLTDN